MRCRRVICLLLLVWAPACAGAGLRHTAATVRGDAQAATVARELVAGFGPSESTRYEDAHCARVHRLGDADYVCALEMIGLHRGEDEYVLTTVDMRDGRPWADGGLAQTSAACLDSPGCWVAQMLPFCRGECSGALPRVGPPGPAIDLRRPATAPPTTDECITAWNLHGGFSAEETSPQTPVLLPTQEEAKPIYTPYLAPASIGYLGHRVRVRPTARGCSVTFDLGHGHGYRITTPGGPNSWTWLWTGDKTLTATANANACQRPDGTLADSGCPSAGSVPQRDISDELRRRHLAAVAAVGGSPYWLGAPFHRAWPAAHPEGHLAVVTYAFSDGHRAVTIAITTSYTPAIPRWAVTGHVIVRAHPEDSAAIVTASRPIPPKLRRAIRRHLRPFLPSDPDANQLPGDVDAAPTRIDHRRPRRPLWFGPVTAGLRATVIANSPAGVGVVRYGGAKAPSRFYVVTYRPLPKRCGSLGCASPPPTPGAFRRYGRETHATWLLAGGWVTTILAPHPHRAAAAISQIAAVTTPTLAIGS